MPEHHPKNVTGVLRWCRVCRKNTMHRVDFKREGPCTEHQASGMSKEQEKRKKRKEEAEQNPTFDF